MISLNLTHVSRPSDQNNKQHLPIDDTVRSTEHRNDIFLSINVVKVNIVKIQFRYLLLNCTI